MFRRRGILMATMVMLIPIALVLVFTLLQEILGEAGTGMMAQRRSKVFYLAQAGLAASFHTWAANNFDAHTHESNGTTVTPNSDPKHLELYGLSGFSVGADGWVHWAWHPGDPVGDSYTRSGSDETLRFQVYNVAGRQWKVVCEAQLDGEVSLQEVGCATEPVYDYLTFDNGDTNDFVHAEQRIASGKIHANGNLYLRPWTTPGFAIPMPPPLPPLVLIQPQNPARLNISADSVTSARRIIRTEDALGNPDPSTGGQVTIASPSHGLAPTPMEGKYDGQDGRGVAFDSYNPNWRSTAMTKYKGAVQDAELGAKKKEVASRLSLLPNGYFDQKAGVHIDSSTSAAWCTDKDFYNQATELPVTVKEIDVAAMAAAGAIPANGILYSRVPIRLVNAHLLPQKLTVASSATIYTKGDFNNDPDGAGPMEPKAASLLTTDRIFNLTSSFDDSASFTYPDPITNPPALATDPPRFAGDSTDELFINAAIVDGVPTEDVRAWVNDPANPFYVASEFMGLGVKQIPGPGLKVAYPVCDPLLENMQNIRVHYRGTWVHQRTAKMAQWDNSDVASDPTLTPWIVKSAYLPPQARDYVQDPNLADPTNGPPLALKAATKMFWRVIR